MFVVKTRKPYVAVTKRQSNSKPVWPIVRRCLGLKPESVLHSSSNRVHDHAFRKQVNEGFTAVRPVKDHVRSFDECVDDVHVFPVCCGVFPDKRLMAVLLREPLSRSSMSLGSLIRCLRDTAIKKFRIVELAYPGAIRVVFSCPRTFHHCPADSPLSSQIIWPVGRWLMESKGTARTT